MKLGLLLLALLSTTQLFGYFQYGGFLKSRSFVFSQSGNLAIYSKLASEISLRRNISGTKTILEYNLYLKNSDGKPEGLHISRWLIDRGTLNILHIDDKLNRELRASHTEEIPSQTEVIGQRFEPSIGANRFGAPLVIETGDTKLVVTNNDETGVVTIYGQKTLEDGQVVKWKDELN